MRNVLVIEDQQDIAGLVRLHLEDLPCKVELAFDGPSGLAAAEKKPFDLVVLDLMLPGMDGLEICRRLRARPPYTPIMMVTAKAAELDRVLGLELGADDYLTKPFSIRGARRARESAFSPHRTPSERIRAEIRGDDAGG